MNYRHRNKVRSSVMELEGRSPGLSLNSPVLQGLHLCFILSLSCLVPCSISALVISGFVTNYLKTYWLKTTTTIYFAHESIAFLCSTQYQLNGGWGVHFHEDSLVRLEGWRWLTLLHVAFMWPYSLGFLTAIVLQE